MATLAKLRPQSAATATQLKREVSEYLQRASKLERNHQQDEASVLYKRVVSLIGTHEGTSAVDDELSSIKRQTNQRLMQSAVQKTPTSNSNGAYQAMVGQLSSHMPRNLDDHEYAEMAEQVFQDPAAFQPVSSDGNYEESNATVLFQLDTGAKLFYMAKNGSIQTTSETLPLTVFEVTYVHRRCRKRTKMALYITLVRMARRVAC